jgi:hypothetical protein
MFEGATAFDHDLSAWNVEGVDNMEDMFRFAGLSQTNLDATLTSWASQSVQNDVPFHLGAKTYSDVGAAALATLRDTYNWDITEQYLLTYDTAPNVIIVGDSEQQRNSGADGTAVEAVPSEGYYFVSWSDGSTANPRTDTNVTDNVTVYPIIEKQPSAQSTSAGTRAKKLRAHGNEEAAQEIEERFLKDTHPTSTPPATTPTPKEHQPSASLEEALERVAALPVELPRTLKTEEDRAVATKLTTVLLELVEVLRTLLTRQAA